MSAHINNGVQINTKKIHLIYITLATLVIIFSTIWAISGFRAEAVMNDASREVPVAVKLHIEQTTVSKKEFREFREEVKEEFKVVKQLIKGE